MKIKELFNKFNIPVRFENIAPDAGQYWTRSDIVVLDLNLKEQLPGCAKLVFLHEMIHATASAKRLNRFERLIGNLGPYMTGSLSYRTEECIAEVGCMVAAIKLGLLNDYNMALIADGIKKNYEEGMVIPVREIRAALKYFTEDDVDFEEEITFAKDYLEAMLDVNFQDTYPKQIAV